MKNSIFEWMNEHLGINHRIIFPAFLGAVVQIKRFSGMTWFKSISSVLIGSICAIYLTPLALNFLPLEWDVESSVSFLIGYGGISILDIVFNYFSSRLKRFESDEGKDQT